MLCISYCFLIYCFCFPRVVNGQGTRTNEVYEILNTVQIKKNRVTLSIKWLNDTISLTQSLNPHEPDTLTVKNEKISLSYGPNCFAHALDSYFKFNGMNHIDLFDKKTVIFAEDLMKILESSFAEVQEFQVQNKRLKAQKEMTENSILVFQNQHEMIGHAVYYGKGTYYSKNGMFPVQEFPDINKIIKTYRDTKTIRVYQLLPEAEAK